jgi:hypothetical protein
LVTTVEAAVQRPILLIAVTLILKALVHRRWPEQLQAAGRRRLGALIYRMPDADLTVPHRFLARSWHVRA